MRKCGTCLKKKLRKWRFGTDCSDCKRQWRAYYRGDTHVSPLELAILSDQMKALKKERKRAKKAEKNSK